jgi:penicillin-binding protein 1A
MKRRKRTNKTSTKIRPVYNDSNNANGIQTEFKPARSKKKLLIILATAVVIILASTIYIWHLSQDLPPLTKLENIDPALATHVYSIDGEIIDSFHRKNRTIAPYYKFPEHLVQALLATEDRQFFDHWGVNLKSFFRALVVSLVTFEKAKGTSTLTMQLARNLNLGFGLERTWKRKIQEILTSIQIERTYSKREILEMYLNINFFGSNSYGIQSAANTFFTKDVDELNVEESALMIGVLKGQSLYNPLSNPDRAIVRRNIVLKSMLDVGYLTKSQYDSMAHMPITLNPSAEQKKVAPYFTEYIRQQLNRLQDSLDVNVYEDGLRVYTTLDARIQRYMDTAIDSVMPLFQRRIRSKSSLRKYLDSKADSTISDSIFNELTTVQIAFVCLDPHNGHILAMVGGRDFEKSQYNRSIQAPRQPGSAFKPFVYTAAIDNGYNPADEFLNQPFVLINDDGTRWTPHNYDNTVSGLMSLREALRGSKNLVSIRLIQEIGPSLVADYARRMGVSTRIRAVPSLALGSSEVYLIELVSAYSIFANNGVQVKPISILKIEDKTGNVIYQNRSPAREVLRKETAFIMNDLLQNVINHGTGYAVRRDYKFYEPAGGKTGTTNDYTDAWFVGFTPQVVSGVWVGFDDPQLSLGRAETGARAALPFWAKFMETMYDSIDFPTMEFPESPNVIQVRICKESKKRATMYCPDVVEELFIIKDAPTETCDVHVGRYSTQKGRRRRF